MHTELARRFAGKPQPEGERETEAIDQSIALWQALWEQYSACLKPLIEGDAELQGVKAKILQRGLYVGKQLLLVHGLMDDNVHPQNSLQFVDALQRADKDFEMVFYPRNRHGVGGRQFERKVLEFMKAALRPEM